MDKDILLSYLKQMDEHLFELESRIKKSGIEDNMDIFWLCELIKNCEEEIKKGGM